MSDATNSATDRSGRLQAAIGDYLDAIQSGRPVDRAAWLADHPDLADELRAFLADYHQFQELAAPLRDVAGAAAEAAPTVSRDGDGVSTGSGSSLDRTSETGNSAAPPAAGTRISYFGDYELLRTLGEGGMGIVFEARQRSLDRIVALKMIRAGRFAGEEDRRRFRNEAAAVALLDHPHIVPVYEVGEHDGDSYFSMKRIDGTSLAGRLGEFLDRPREAARLVATMARALHHAHQRGVLHRDLKPSNILLDARAEPHLTDFGLAKRIEGPGAAEMTHSGAILGTPAYMAPEQAGGRRGEVTTATDVHGLGALLYALLTGHAPFRGESVADTLVQVREGSPEPIRRANARVPRDLETICMRCLEREPRRRYASADAVAEELGRWLRGEPIAARPAGKLERGWMWCRRNPMVAGLTASVATALVVGTGVSTNFAVRASNQARAEREEGLRADGAEKEMRKAIEEIEGSFARSLLRWLDDGGDGKDALGALEVENLWKLAGNGSGSLGLRFLDEATRRPKSARQLCARSEPALIATVGLDPKKREQAIALLMNRLAQPGLPLAQKVDLAFTALELADRTGPDMGTCEGVLVEAMKANLPGQGRFVGMYHLTSSAERLEPATAGRLILRALEMNPTPSERDGLIAALTKVASRLEPDAAGRLVLRALSMKSVSSEGQRLAVALATVSSRLAPPESDRVCKEAFRLLTDALVRKGRPSLEEDRFDRGDVPLASGFTALAARLPRGEAARSLTEALGRVTDPAARRRLASGLATVIAELPPEEVSGIPPAVALALAEALETDDNAPRDLASGLAKLAKSWRKPEPADVRPVVRSLAAALKAEKDPWHRKDLAWALAPMAERLGPKESAPICLAAAESLSSGWTPEKKLDLSNEWLSPFLAVIVRLPMDIAARNARLLATVTDSEVHRAQNLQLSLDGLDRDDAARAARVFVATLRQEKDPSLREWLGAWLCVLAGKMDPEEAARVCGPVLEDMNKAVATYWSSGSESLIDGFTVVASRQTATVASRSARVLADTFKEERNSLDRSKVAKGLATLAGRMEPVEAERICSEAARIVAADLRLHTDDLNLLTYDAEALAALAGRMERLEAQRMCSEAAPIFSRAWSRGKDAIAVGISTLPQVMALMAARMEPVEGARMLVELLERGTDGSNSMTVARQLLTVTARMEPGTAVPWVERAVDTLLRARSAKHRDALDPHRLDSSIDRPPGHPSDLEANAMDRRSFAASVAELLPRLEARRANARAASLAALMCSEGDASHRGDIWLEPGDWNWGSGPVVLSRILTDTSPMQRAARSLRMAVPTLGLGIGALPASMSFAVEPWPCRLTTQELVDLLKMPTCFGKARRVVLDHLGNLHGRRFDNHWDFVRFAQEKHLSVDLTTPPRRPDLAALGTDKPAPR